MASGYGLTGGKRVLRDPDFVHERQKAIRWCRTVRRWLIHGPGVSRCFPFWQEYLACHVMNQGDPDARNKGACAPVLEDYYECLHHKKEVSLKQWTVPTLYTI